MASMARMFIDSKFAYERIIPHLQYAISVFDHSLPHRQLCHIGDTRLKKTIKPTVAKYSMLMLLWFGSSSSIYFHIHIFSYFGSASVSRCHRRRRYLYSTDNNWNNVCNRFEFRTALFAHVSFTLSVFHPSPQLCRIIII